MASDPLIVGYAGLDPDQPKRPGLVTAFGVTSIVIGTFGVMFGLLCGGRPLLVLELRPAEAFGGVEFAAVPFPKRPPSHVWCQRNAKRL